VSSPEIVGELNEHIDIADCMLFSFFALKNDYRILDSLYSDLIDRHISVVGL
jgi:hypothetical protein